MDYSGGVTTSQVTSAKDKNEALITLSHTVGTDTQTVVAKVSAFEAQPYANFETVESQTYPMALAIVWANHVNSKVFRGKPAGTWRVVNVEYERLDMSAATKLWKFRWQIQYNRDGWNPHVFFVDPASGEIPADVVAGVGDKDVDWYDEVDFDLKFT